jgi:hypothetical protein
MARQVIVLRTIQSGQSKEEIEGFLLSHFPASKLGNSANDERPKFKDWKRTQL